MKNDFYFPTEGEEGSILDRCRKYLYSDYPQSVAWDVCKKPKVCLNMISTLQQYGGDKIALRFAQEVLRQQSEFL